MVHTAGSQQSTLEFRPVLLFCALSGIAVALWWAPLAATFSLALHDEQYTHILLILPICAALIFLDWNSPGVERSFSLPTAAVMLVAAFTSIFVSRVSELGSDVQVSLRMFTFVVWCIAAFVFSFSRRASRHALFPLLFLFWLVPFPDFVLNAIVSFLQYTSAAAARAIFFLVRVPVEQRGLLIHIPDLTLEVAPECSSIRSSLILVVTTMVLGHLLLQSWWRKLLLVVLAILLAIAKNGLRIFVLGFLAIRVDRSYLAGWLHHQGGFIFFLIALAGVLAALWVFRRGEKRGIKSGASTSF